MTIRVALIGTGNVGKPALVQLINDSAVRADRRVGLVGGQGGQGRRRACRT